MPSVSVPHYHDILQQDIVRPARQRGSEVEGVLLVAQRGRAMACRVHRDVRHRDVAGWWNIRDAAEYDDAC